MKFPWRAAVHLIGMVLIAILLALLWQGCGGDEPSAGRNDGTPKTAAPERQDDFQAMPVTHRPKRLAAISHEACRECHAAEVEAWERSDHAHANRPASADFKNAFLGGNYVTEGRYVFAPTAERDRLLIEIVRGTGEREPYVAEGILGRTPLWQALVPFPGGRWQTTTTAYDPRNDEWYDVFAGQERQPGEWGHWTGQGMNWNANCAYCHMTEFKKNFDVIKNAYESRWTGHGISCVECHAGAAEHAVAARKGRPKEHLAELTGEQVKMNCASCHSRRGELTAEGFMPGDHFHQHFDLALPDQRGLYHPDGQILDEVFVYASFEMSRMGHAGVDCRDCHNAHSGELILPVENNALCMRCHSVGQEEAPVIDIVAHGHHRAGSEGNQCVVCHMPHETYMGRDDRRDHGFHSPDPLMTRELGIPNACNDCHEDQGLDWQVRHAEAWYGEKLAESRQRNRARALHAAYEGDPAAVAALLALAETEEIDVWRASYTGLLGNYPGAPEAAGFLRKAMLDEDPLVRARAVTGLAQQPGSVALLRDALGDDYRNVRNAAALGLQQNGEPFRDDRAQEEYQQYLEFNSDRPTPAFLLAQQALRSGDQKRFRILVERAIGLDPINPEMLRQGAVMASMAGDLARAEQYLRDGLQHAPENAALHYSLALLYAEQGNLDAAVASLQRTVDLDPSFARAWYNLAIARYQQGDADAAADALQRAAPQMRGDPGFQQMHRLLEGD
ncbi:MAG: tetratricopeptide repeat protein [Opitutales bacterium]